MSATVVINKRDKSKMPDKPAVVIYRDWLLPPSETFVLGQAEALRRFTPYYVGSCLKKVCSLLKSELWSSMEVA